MAICFKNCVLRQFVLKTVCCLRYENEPNIKIIVSSEIRKASYAGT